MRTIQITLDEHLLADVHKAGKSIGLDVTQIIREALSGWLKRREALRFEHEWIAALKKNPDETSRAEDWLETQTWSES